MTSDKIFSKIRNTKYIYIIVIIGAVIMLFSSFSVDNEEEKKNGEYTEESESEEMRLERILSEITGVGEAKVMITYYESTKKTIAYEKKVDKRADTIQGFGGESVDEKAVMAEGEPVVIKQVYPEVKGVIVVSKGAGSPSVNQAICEAVSTALGIGMHKICVLPGGM